MVPADYLERVYAGVLGKLIGIYIGLPVEMWPHQTIADRFGEVPYYYHDRVGVPLVNTSDGVTGMFTFIRALEDHGISRDLTAEQIGQSWLNYYIPQRTAFWWGGFGISSEHTAWQRLKDGIAAPQSGSIALNGATMAEQIGARIFVDAWALLCPGDPEQAAEWARKSGSVSHDGEAIYGAQLVAAMEAQAFVESDLNALIDTGLQCVPRDSLIYSSTQQIREWSAEDNDWRATRERIAQHYGPDKYGGTCHIVPNHALVMLGLLYGENDFGKSLMITTTSGWDTDCNASAVGCLMGVKNGLSGIDAGLQNGTDWRGPVRDRLYLSTVDGGRAITDAAREAVIIANLGRALADEATQLPKYGARFHFNLPGSVQGFGVENGDDNQPTLHLQNVPGHSRSGERSLAIEYSDAVRAALVTTATFTLPEAISAMNKAVDASVKFYYNLVASPTLYTGQTVRAAIEADAANAAAISCRLVVRTYSENDELRPIHGTQTHLKPGTHEEISWTVPETGGEPVAEVGLEIGGAQSSGSGTIYLDFLTWDGAPDVTFRKPQSKSTMWQRAWVDATENCIWWTGAAFRLTQGHGRGLLIQGTREWRDYEVESTIAPRMANAFGVAARVQGMTRYYALLLHHDQVARLVKVRDGIQTILAEQPFAWQSEVEYLFCLRVTDNRLQGFINDTALQAEDKTQPLENGAIALLCETGNCSSQSVTVRP